MRRDRLNFGYDNRFQNPTICSRRLPCSSDPYTFYDLGDSYCSNPFWSSCPHRMACAGCDFNIPKASARAQALESRASIGHYLEAVPLTADERAVVEGDLEKLNGLIRKLDDVPTPDGRTPSQIEANKSR
ncbi:ORF4-like protein [Pseudomonas syringae pv. pisi]|nr:ORF4-like protein [Pseudomonas syringae pv. pisi]